MRAHRCQFRVLILYPAATCLYYVAMEINTSLERESFGEAGIVWPKQVNSSVLFE